MKAVFTKKSTQEPGGYPASGEIVIYSVMRNGKNTYIFLPNGILIAVLEKSWKDVVAHMESKGFALEYRV